MKLLSKAVVLLIAVLSINASCKKEDPEPLKSNPAPSTKLESNLNLSITANTADAFPDDEVVFTIQLKNNGPDSANRVAVKINLSEGFKYKAYSTTSQSEYKSKNGEWLVPVIENNSTLELTIKVTLKEQGDCLANAEITASSNFDPNSIPNNNQPEEDDQVSTWIKRLTQDINNKISVSTCAIINAGDGLTIDASGNLFAANYAQSKVFKIGSDGSINTFLSNQPGAAGMVFNNQGILFLARYTNNDIVRVNSTGSVLGAFASGVGGTISLDFDSKGRLYTNNNYNLALTRIDLSGNKKIIATKTHNNSSLTIDDNDNIYVSDYDSGIIRKLDADTYNESVFTTLPVQAIGFIIHSHGTLFASGIKDNVIFKIDLKGNYEKIAGTKGVAGISDGKGDEATFDKPNGMVTSSDGKTLFVAQQGNKSGIRKIIGY